MMTREQLNNLDHDVLVTMFLNLQEQLRSQSEAIEKLTEQIRLMNTRTFGRSTEKGITDESQISLFDDILNEFEFNADGKPEPEAEEIIVSEHSRKKRKGKREEDLSGYPVVVIDHEIEEEKLSLAFPDGYSELPHETYKKLEMIPQTFQVQEHHIHIYKGKDGTILRADHPKEMIEKSIATPSLVAGIINAKYTNAAPLYRQEQEFARNDVNISRQTMSNWVIKTTERYLSLVYDRLKDAVISADVIHADETPVMVKNDGRDGMHQSYMWVYRTGEMCKAVPAVVYDYQKTRNADAPAEMLKGFGGTLVCDGYQVYHALQNREETEFGVAGCWVHARRPFADVIKSVGKEKANGTAAYEAYMRIQEIFHEDNLLKKLPQSQRKDARKKKVKPLVDDFFRWVKDMMPKIAPGSQTAKGLKYCINQEKYLRTFLNNPKVPLDNNAAERAIRPFCVGKKNWKLIDTARGAQTSAMLYSIVESAKENDLNIYRYIRHLLTEIPLHMDETNLDFLDDLTPWSDKLPNECRKQNTAN